MKFPFAYYQALHNRLKIFSSEKNLVQTKNLISVLSRMLGMVKFCPKILKANFVKLKAAKDGLIGMEHICATYKQNKTN